jgi:hypothetical protein
MQRKASWLIPLSFFAMTAVTAADAGECMSMSVSPKQALAPVNLRVRVRIEPNADNRVLRIVADSPELSQAVRFNSMAIVRQRRSALNIRTCGRQLRDHQRAGQQHGREPPWFIRPPTWFPWEENRRSGISFVADSELCRHSKPNQTTRAVADDLNETPHFTHRQAIDPPS